MARVRLAAACLLVFSASCAGTSGELSSPGVTSSTVAVTSSTTASTLIPVTEPVEVGALLDLTTFAATQRQKGSGFVGVADAPSVGVTFLQSDDGLEWSILPGQPPLGLPESTVGPYRLWRFGDGYLLYGSAGHVDDRLIGEDPLVAISSDLSDWEIVDLPGIDNFFYQGRWTPPDPGGVTADGQTAVFTGFNRIAESGLSGRVAYVLRPGEAPAVIDGPRWVGSVSPVGDDFVGVSFERGAKFFLHRLVGSRWEPMADHSANQRNGPEIRSVGETLILASQGEYFVSDDLGQNWDDLPSVSTAILDFGYFGYLGAAGPVEPPFGTPERFAITSDGRTWSDIALPDGAVDISHILTTETGILSVVQFPGVDRHELIFSPYP